MDQFQQAEFKVESLFLAIIQIVEGAQNNLQIPCQLFFSEQQRSSGRTRTLIARDLQ